MSEDKQSNIIIARPIPPGYTLIAKPVIGAPPIPPFFLHHEELHQVDASHYSSGSSGEKTNAENEEAVANSNGPLVMMWTTKHPEGRLQPLRQPEPPVYFQPHR